MCIPCKWAVPIRHSLRIMEVSFKVANSRPPVPLAQVWRNRNSKHVSSISEIPTMRTGIDSEWGGKRRLIIGSRCVPLRIISLHFGYRLRWLHRSLENVPDLRSKTRRISSKLEMPMETAVTQGVKKSQ